MRKLYLFTLSSILLSANTLPPKNPINTGYETQREEKLLNKHLKSLKKATTTIDEIKISAPKPSLKDINLGPSFRLNGVSIKGNTTFEQKEIISFVKPYLGLQVYTKTLKDIAQKITQLYYSKGYVTSKCILPQQKVKNGNVTFQIIEDKLGSITLSGENAHEYDTKLFSKYFHKLQGKIINAKELNTKLKLLQYLPISKITPTLSHIRPGVSNLILKITEAKQQISLSLNNRGSEYSGIYRTTLTGNINNIVGISDSLFLSVTTSQTPQHYSALNASYRHPIGENGAKISWGISNLNYQLNPDEMNSRAVFYDGESSQFNLAYDKPLFFFQKINIWLNLSFNYKSLSSRTLENKTGSILVHSLDKTSVISIGTTINFLDSYKGINNFSFKVSQAIPNLFNSMTQEDIDRKTYRMEYDSSTIQELKKQKVAANAKKDDITESILATLIKEEAFKNLAITAPQKYGKNLKAAFRKYYISASRQQYFPANFTGSLSFHGEYTSARIPQAYEFSTGDYGYSASININNNFNSKYFNMGIGYGYTKVYEYDLELTLHSSGEVSKSPNISMNAYYNDFYLNLSYQLNLDKWDANENNIKFNLGYSW